MKITTTHMFEVQALYGLLFGVLFLGTTAVGQFVQPTGGPNAAGSNSVGPLVATSTAQVKEGGLGASYFTATNKICLGASNCITDWWSSSASASCKLEVKHIHSPSLYPGVRTAACDTYLAENAKLDGWVSTGFDNCTGENGGNDDCDNWAHCTFMRMVCSGAATTTPATYQAMIGPTTAMPYTFFGDAQAFVRYPQCKDGVDNDGSGGIDYPTDPQCDSYGDDNESI